MNSKKLTIKQQKFADEYLKTGNATQSYLKVYKSTVKSAEAASSLLLRKFKVKEYIEKGRAKLDKQSRFSHEQILEDLQSIAQTCLETDENGKPIDPKAAIKCKELIGKHFGMFTQKIEASISNGQQTAEAKAMFQTMTTEEKIKWLDSRS